MKSCVSGDNEIDPVEISSQSVTVALLTNNVSFHEMKSIQMIHRFSRIISILVDLSSGHMKLVSANTFEVVRLYPPW